MTDNVFELGDDIKFGNLTPELKEKWLTALRSGDYTQGAMVLRSAHDTFCCLGVLCDVAGLGWERGTTYDDGTRGAFYAADSGITGVIPVRFADTFGIDGAGAFYVADTRQSWSLKVGEWDGLPVYSSSLSDLNDNHEEFTFERIAEVIEKHF